MTQWALEAVNLKKSYGALQVIDDVSLRLRPGARHALIGPNGAGKTTLVGLLSGILPPDSGRVLINGDDVTAASPRERTEKGLARTFQVNNLFRGLTVFENIFIAVSERGGVAGNLFRPARGRALLLEQTQAVINALGLAEDADRRISEISYGHQRLVEIGVALSLKPRVLLLDEPVAGIEKADTELVLAVIGQLDPSMSLLIIEHDMQVVCRLATEVTVLVAGRVLMTGTPSEVMASQEVQSVYLGKSSHARATDLLVGA